MKQLILAFPGMGKTPTCRRLANSLDLDFGMFRTALAVPKEDEERIIPNFISLIDAYLSEWWNVFTNEPKLLNYPELYKICKKSHIVVFLPEGRGIAHCARKLSVSKDQIFEWISDWERIANENDIKVKFISVGLDTYLDALNQTAVLQKEPINTDKF